jgi:hypothetical protein
MELIQDGAIAFLSAVGLTACVWLIAGAFLTGKCRNPEVRLILPLRDDAPGLESDLRDLLRTRHTLPLAKILLVDCGMTDEARQTAEYFCLRRKNVELVDAKGLKLE